MTATTPIEESETTLQLTGLARGKKRDIKLQAIKRNVSASQLMVAAYDEYVKLHPAS